MGMFEIETIGNCGDLYAGLMFRVKVKMINMMTPWIKIFWIDFFCNACAKQHDIGCDALDWTYPDKAYAEYKKLTHDFFIACLTEAGGDPSEDF